MSKFATASFVNDKGHTVTGDFVAETSNAWHIGIRGKVQLLYKEEWTSTANPSSGFDFGGLFGGR